MHHAGITKVNTDVAGPFCYRRLDDDYLVTNDFAEWAFLSADEFRSFVEGDLDTAGPLYGDLKSKGFIHGEIALEDALRKIRRRYSPTQAGPSCHTLAVTSADGTIAMTSDWGERAVDMAFISTSQSVELVFSGAGAAQWDVVQPLIQFALDKNKLARKTLSFRIEGDLEGLTPEAIAWLAENKVQAVVAVNVDTLAGTDGPAMALVKALNEAYADAGHEALRVELAVPCTAEVVAKGGALLDAVAALGCRVFQWQGNAESEVASDALNTLYEGILGGDTDGPVERRLSALAGAVVGNARSEVLSGGVHELAYGADGTVYASAVGLAIGEGGDPMFALGHVAGSGYHDLMTHPTVRAITLAAQTYGQPGYVDWVYKPFTGPSPARAYAEHGSLHGRTLESRHFRQDQFVLDALFRHVRTQGTGRLNALSDVLG
jgi:uncharacterized protein